MSTGHLGCNTEPLGFESNTVMTTLSLSLCLCLSASVKDAFISSMLSRESPSVSCRRWAYVDVKEARFMRYLLEVWQHDILHTVPDIQFSVAQ